MHGRSPAELSLDQTWLCPSCTCLHLSASTVAHPQEYIHCVSAKPQASMGACKQILGEHFLYNDASADLLASQQCDSLSYCVMHCPSFRLVLQIALASGRACQQEAGCPNLLGLPMQGVLHRSSSAALGGEGSSASSMTVELLLRVDALLAWCCRPSVRASRLGNGRTCAAASDRPRGRSLPQRFWCT